MLNKRLRKAKIITLRAIALKLYVDEVLPGDSFKAKIITLRAIALKLAVAVAFFSSSTGEDHNATSYSTETPCACALRSAPGAKIITLRAIALKHLTGADRSRLGNSRRS